MFHRALITAILLFWLVMTGLLVRVELFPDKNDVLPVPFSHVVKLIFLHQQPSDLVIYGQRQRIGSLHLQPQRVKTGGETGAGPIFVNILAGTGAVAVNLPGLPAGRMTFRLSLELTEAQELQEFEWAATLHTPRQPGPSLGFALDGRPALDRFHYAVRRGETVLKEASGTAAELLADPDLAAIGFDPRPLIQQWEAQQRAAAARPGGAASQFALGAHRGTLRLNGEDIDTFIVSARYADSLESTMHVSQLGQVLSVKTFAGYDLYDEALAP